MAYDIELMRHSLAHVMAAAVKKLHPEVKFAGGPAIENGFYYDFDTEYRFSEEDFAKIEKEMRDLIKSNGRFEQKIVSLDEAKEIFADQPYKMEWLNEYDSAGEKLSIYTFRDFTDLCRGPHVESSKTCHVMDSKSAVLQVHTGRGIPKIKCCNVSMLMRLQAKMN